MFDDMCRRHVTVRLGVMLQVINGEHRGWWRGGCAKMESTHWMCGRGTKPTASLTASHCSYNGRI
jgi:hypothetical protein